MLPTLNDPRHIAHLRSNSHLHSQTGDMLRGVMHICRQDYPILLFGCILGYERFCIMTSNSEVLEFGGWAINIAWQEDPDCSVIFTIGAGDGIASNGVPISSWKCPQVDFERAIDELIDELALGENRFDRVFMNKQRRETITNAVEVDRSENFVREMAKVTELLKRDVITQYELARKLFDSVKFYKPDLNSIQYVLRGLIPTCRFILYEIITEIEEKGSFECNVPYWREAPLESDVEREAKRHAQNLVSCEVLKKLLDEISRNSKETDV